MRRLILVLLCLSFVVPQAAHAGAPDQVLQGLVRTLAAPFEVPKEIFAGLARPPFPLGILTGAISGATKAVSGVLGGVADIAQGVAPLLKVALPFLL